MAHVRKLLRDAVKAAMIARDSGVSAYKTAAQDRVYIRGSQPNPEGNCPYILIKTPLEQSERLSADNDLMRVITLELELGLFKSSGVCEDELDAFCVEVEKILDAGISPAFDYVLASSEFDYPREGSEEFGIATLTYEVEIITANGDPETSVKS